MPDYEHPGVYVDEVAPPTPIDGVTTDGGRALNWLKGPHVFRNIVVAGAMLAALNVLLAIFPGDLIVLLIRAPGGIESLLAIIGSAIVLTVLRALVGWRRRKAGRPELLFGRVAVGVFLFKLVNLAAVVICLPTLLLAWAVTPIPERILLAAGINTLVGGVLIGTAGGIVRDLLLLAQAARNEP